MPPPPPIPHALIEDPPEPPEIPASAPLQVPRAPEETTVALPVAVFSEELRLHLSPLREDLKRLELTVRQSVQQSLHHNIDQVIMASRGTAAPFMHRTQSNETTATRRVRHEPGTTSKSTVGVLEDMSEHSDDSEGSQHELGMKRRGGRKALGVLGELDSNVKAKQEARRRASIVHLTEADRQELVVKKRASTDAASINKMRTFGTMRSIATLATLATTSHTVNGAAAAAPTVAEPENSNNLGKSREQTSADGAAGSASHEPDQHQHQHPERAPADFKKYHSMKSLRSMKSDLEVENRLTRMKSQKTSIQMPQASQQPGVFQAQFWRNSAAKAVEHGIFMILATALPPVMIVLNSATLAWQTEWTAANLDQDLPDTFLWIEIFFCFFFSVELVLRFVASGKAFFCGAEWAWNLFDFVAVGLQILEAALHTTDVGSLAWVRVLRVLRLARLVRLVRWLHMIRELHTIIYSIGSSLKSLFWTVVFLSMVMYVAGLFLCTISVEWRKGNLHMEQTAGQDLDQYWGTLPKALLTLFQAITSGISWRECVNPLIDHISPVMGLIFSGYIAFAILALMNVVTGVFVESAMQNSKNDEQMTMVAKLREVFSSTDIDGSGLITYDEFNAALGDPGMEHIFAALDLDLSEARSLFRLLDTDRSGSVEVEDFVAGMLRLRGMASAMDMAIMIYESSRFQKRVKAHMHKVEHRLRWIQHNMSGQHGAAHGGIGGLGIDSQAFG